MRGDPRSHGLWEKTAPPGPETPPLRGDHHVEVAIIGAGFTGLSTALHLAEAGIRAAVLEAREIGFGASGRNAGLVNAGLWVMPDEIARSLGETRGEQLLSLLGDAPALVYDIVARHGIDCALERKGTLHCAVGDKGLAEIVQRHAQWQKRGAPVSLVDAEETARLTGTAVYRGALLDRRAGTIQPLAYVRGLGHAAIAKGAAIHADSAVRRITRDGERWRIETAEGSLSAEWIVVATNAYPTDGMPWPEIRAALTHLPYFNIATQPLNADLRKLILPELHGAWDTRMLLRSFRMDAAGRLVFGSVGALRGAGAAIHPAWARRHLRRFFPQLGDVPFEAEWYGLIGMTRDALPRFREMAPKVIGFSGYNGRGIAPGTAFGKMLADLVLNRIGHDDLPLPVATKERPSMRVLRQSFYETGAVLAHLVADRTLM